MSNIVIKAVSVTALTAFMVVWSAQSHLFGAADSYEGEIVEGGKIGLKDKKQYSFVPGKGLGKGAIDPRQTVRATGYATEYPLTLKAGQPIKITATVTGKDRTAGILLLDPTRRPIAGSAPDIKTVQLDISEVNASGKYTVVVFSDQVGPFSLRADGPGVEELGRKSLEEKIARLEKELADAREQLKKLDEKEKKDKK